MRFATICALLTFGVIATELHERHIQPENVPSPNWLNELKLSEDDDDAILDWAWFDNWEE